ncbi:glycerol-3-phosphate dehydrogenase [Actibacterium mucosum KCTC 23349]|uniref:Glycerol-3-phosphate dehydrogenase n=1 Tax=Actibacterium mucosum KCTC 23349 TaxID=1454373 RepID=A0A037ZGS6_9RHOB|nr:glycerol-3-phosphate dehydrogenase/oxidase [Actibacterium mucosum]KAJ54741.1 glycerol-3-phosphate dehydrogenase [Actibacterium mucosum KCTC 23349]
MPETRANTWADLAADPTFDAIVIGGGINGISTWRELALQGLRVLLVERSDFCSGCSAAPSRMIHGGLRYLENGEFDLVRESLAERDALLRNAPHLVRPLPTTVPITQVFSGIFNGALGFLTKRSRPANRGAVVIKLGLAFYDIFTAKRRQMPRHTFRGRAATFAAWPRLNPKLKFSATYYDAWISHPERLGLELITDTLRDCPAARALNYAELSRTDETILVRDLTNQAEVHVTARAMVNATGAWLDETNRDLLPNGGNARFVGGTKGSHLIIDNPDLLAALNGHMIYFENVDGRVCILFPYLGRVLLGSTDLRVDQAGPVRCEDDELDYILTSLRHVFPDIRVAPDQIVYTYSGVRPLPRSDEGFTGRISRGHFTRRIDGTPPVFCMIGGKWTTFRAFGEQSADMVLEALGHSRKVATLDRAIGGGQGFPADQAALQRQADTLSRRFNVPLPRAEHMLQHYGSRAEEILGHCAAGPDAPLCPGSAYTTSEIGWIIDNEMVQSPADILQRRTDLAITGAISARVIEAVTNQLAQARGWPAEKTAAEITRFRAALHRFHRVDPATLAARDARCDTDQSTQG